MRREVVVGSKVVVAGRSETVVGADWIRRRTGVSAAARARAGMVVVVVV